MKRLESAGILDKVIEFVAVAVVSIGAESSVVSQILKNRLHREDRSTFSSDVTQSEKNGVVVTEDRLDVDIFHKNPPSSASFTPLPERR